MSQSAGLATVRKRNVTIYNAKRRNGKKALTPQGALTGDSPLQTESHDVAPIAAIPLKQSSIDDVLARLRLASDAGNEQSFHEAYALIDWLQQAPEIIERVVRLAFQSGLHYLAQTLARNGAALHPDHLGLHKFARALNPASAQVSHGTHDPAVRADTQWFAKHSAEHYGQWVAVKNGQLISAAPTIQQLEAQIGDLRSATVAHVVWK
jgi:hypothetical protein